MSQQTPHQRTRPRWTAISVALFVAGLEMLALGLLAQVWRGDSSLSFTGMLLMPIEALATIGPSYVMASGAVLMIASFVLARRKLTPLEEEEAPPDWTIVSAALFVIGLLVVVPSGLCTGIMIVSSGGGLFTFALILGGVPIAIGATLVAIGLSTRRSD
jgi:hypothetical protein